MISKVLISAWALEKSRLAHLVGYIYSTNGNAFITSQTYHDLQLSVKASFFIAAWFLESSQGGLKHLLLLMIGSDLQEELDGVVRTLSHNRNFCMLALQFNLANAQQVAHVFEKNPDMRRPDRRRDFSKRDLRRVKDWAKNALVLPPDESLASLWSQGGCLAKIDLIKSDLFVVKDVDSYFSELGSEVGGSLLAPCGMEIGVAVSFEDDAPTPLPSSELERDGTLEPLCEFGICMQDQADVNNEQIAEIIPFCIVGGKEIHKKSLVRCAFLHEPLMSTDRLRRVRGHAK